MSQADHLAELRAIGYTADTLAPLLAIENQANADAEAYCSVEGFNYEAAAAETSEAVGALFGGTLPAGFFVNGDPRGYALKLAEGTGSISYRDWGGYEILAPDFEPEAEAEPEDGPTFAERIGLPPGHRVTLGGEFVPVSAADRLEYLRGELRAERISTGELIELQGLADEIDPGDVELLEAAGVPEFPDDEPDVPGAFTLRIEWGNAAMTTQDDLATALSGVAAEIAGGAVDGNVRDENGNTVGAFGFTTD